MTDIAALLNPWRWLILLGLVAAMVAGYFAWAAHQRSIGAQEERTLWQAALSDQKAKAASQLATETNRVRESESRLRQALATLEKQDHAAADIIERLRSDLRAKSLAAGGPGLRDPFAPSRCGSGGGGATSPTAASAGDRPADGAETGRVLSERFENLLLDRAEEADAVNRAYIACRADAMNLRAAPH